MSSDGAKMWSTGMSQFSTPEKDSPHDSNHYSCASGANRMQRIIPDFAQRKRVCCRKPACSLCQQPARDLLLLHLLLLPASSPPLSSYYIAYCGPPTVHYALFTVYMMLLHKVLTKSHLHGVGAAATLLFFAPSYPLLLTGRVMYGLGIGFAMHAAPAYIAETASASVRGLLIR